MSFPYIGTREYGRHMRRERWFLCALCQRPTPESDTTVPQWPHPHAGLRVCSNDLDELGWQELRLLNPPTTGDDEGGS
jgi:hypothetical protein